MNIIEYLNIIIYYYLYEIYESFHHIEMTVDDSTGEIITIHMAKDLKTFRKSIKQLSNEK